VLGIHGHVIAHSEVSLPSLCIFSCVASVVNISLSRNFLNVFNSKLIIQISFCQSMKYSVICGEKVGENTSPLAFDESDIQDILPVPISSFIKDSKNTYNFNPRNNIPDIDNLKDDQCSYTPFQTQLGILGCGTTESIDPPASSSLESRIKKLERSAGLTFVVIQLLKTGWNSSKSRIDLQITHLTKLQNDLKDAHNLVDSSRQRQKLRSFDVKRDPLCRALPDVLNLQERIAQQQSLIIAEENKESSLRSLVTTNTAALQQIMTDLWRLDRQVHMYVQSPY
jgi:hypothetical protein